MRGDSGKIGTKLGVRELLKRILVWTTKFWEYGENTCRDGRNSGGEGEIGR